MFASFFSYCIPKGTVSDGVIYAYFRNCIAKCDFNMLCGNLKVFELSLYKCSVSDFCNAKCR